MRIPENLRLLTVFLMVFLLSNVCSLSATATSVSQQGSYSMLSTASVINEELNQVEMKNIIQDYLDQANVQSELTKNGVSPEELKQRLASLSEAEMRQLSMQVSEARFGGDILVTILLVVLIIYIFKRI